MLSTLVSLIPRDHGPHRTENSMLLSRIGTPHTHHYKCAKLALTKGKHVLCEKPVTVNAAELRDLIKLAKENKVFFMEAMWTRFLPIAQEVARIIRSRELGDVKVVWVSCPCNHPGAIDLKMHHDRHADLSGDFDIDSQYHLVVMMIHIY